MARVKREEDGSYTVRGFLRRKPDLVYGFAIVGGKILIVRKSREGDAGDEHAAKEVLKKHLQLADDIDTGLLRKKQVR